MAEWVSPSLHRSITHVTFSGDADQGFPAQREGVPDTARRFGAWKRNGVGVVPLDRRDHCSAIRAMPPDGRCRPPNLNLHLTLRLPLPYYGRTFEDHLETSSIRKRVVHRGRGGTGSELRSAGIQTTRRLEGRSSK